MGIKVKAIERNVAFEKGKQKWAYVMQADLYGQLTQSKVIEEAAVRSGLAKQVINAPGVPSEQSSPHGPPRVTPWLYRDSAPSDSV